MTLPDYQVISNYSASNNFGTKKKYGVPRQDRNSPLDKWKIQDRIEEGPEGGAKKNGYYQDCCERPFWQGQD